MNNILCKCNHCNDTFEKGLLVTTSYFWDKEKKIPVRVCPNCCSENWEEIKEES